VLEALTANPDVWAKTVFLLNYDENDGYFDHALSPAVPSYDTNCDLTGKTTMPTQGLYFNNATRIYQTASYLDPRDTISGNVRPWGMGYRVPFFVVSPWSKGGWVNSEVADHVSVPLFIEKWLGITVPAISNWHRSVSSDLTSFFDFRTPNAQFPSLPDLSGYAASDAASEALPPVLPPAEQELPTQEPQHAPSRALPYILDAKASMGGDGRITLDFINDGKKGAVFHVYDYYNLDLIPRRYTVEAGKTLSDDFWNTQAQNYAGQPLGKYNLWVYGPNGFVRHFKGQLRDNRATGFTHPDVQLAYDTEHSGMHITLSHNAAEELEFALRDNAYGVAPQTIRLLPGQTTKLFWPVRNSGNWYDVSLAGPDGFLRKFAGRMEDGKHHITDPAMGRAVAHYDEPPRSA
jgi:phospholipase C